MSDAIGPSSSRQARQPTWYVDRLTFASVLRVASDARRGTTIIHYSIDPAVGPLLRAVGAASAHETDIRMGDLNLSVVRTVDGVAACNARMEIVRDYLARVRLHWATTLAPLRILTGCDPDRVLLFLAKVAEPRLVRLLSNAFLAAWDSRDSGAPPRFLYRPIPWLEDFDAILAEHAGVHPVPVSALRPAHARVGTSTPPVVGRVAGSPAHSRGRIHLSRPFAGTYSTSLSTNLRCSFFMFALTGLPRGKTLMHVRPNPGMGTAGASHEEARMLADMGVGLVGLKSGAVSPEDGPTWRPGATFASGVLRVGFGLLRAAIRAVFTGRRVPWWVWRALVEYGVRFAWWRDVFSANRIAVHIDNEDFSPSTVPMNDALASVGGVSFSYQWSDLQVATVALAGSADVQFCFSPAYLPLWRTNASAVGRLVSVGYITDHAFEAVRPAAGALRERVLESGARYVVTYFDENSSDDAYSAVTNAMSCETYEALLNEVLADPTLAVLAKPKRPGTFARRHARIADLIARATSTGRFLVLGGEGAMTNEYPSQAAQAADLCLGGLLGRTAVLEGFLSGTKGVFFDDVGLTNASEYTTELGRTLFPSIDDLLRALRRFREDPQSVPGFGDLTEWAAPKDPFRDGKASLRMGSYILWVREALEAGATREEAVATADLRFGEAWSADNIITLRAQTDATGEGKIA